MARESKPATELPRVHDVTGLKSSLAAVAVPFLFTINRLLPSRRDSVWTHPNAGLAGSLSPYNYPFVWFRSFLCAPLSGPLPIRLRNIETLHLKTRKKTRRRDKGSTGNGKVFFGRAVRAKHTRRAGEQRCDWPSMEHLHWKKVVGFTALIYLKLTSLGQ